MQLTVQNSRSDHPIPLIEGISLHSNFNPIKEAQNIVEAQVSYPLKNNLFLVLGLGFGYHVEELIRTISEHVNNFEIIVIEPDPEIVAKYMEIFGQPTSFEIRSGYNVSAYFECENFANFLSQSPNVVKLPSAISCFSSFYKNFLKYRASNTMGDYHHLLDQKIKDDFTKYNLETTFGNLSDIIRNKEDDITQTEFFLLALQEIYEQEEQK